MTTVHAAIGNSDDKLSQTRWSEYVYDFRKVMTDLSTSVHGVWYSAPDQPFQNCCVAVMVNQATMPILRERLADLRKRYDQDSIALNVSDTELV